ncbi:BAG family molecular chaperone regulator 7 [Nymphaea thermarum]|nr:BAG family molecular chaperone regulator 7 [Nymphaea thermarum]
MSFFSNTQFFCDPLLEHHHHLPFSPFSRAPLGSHHLLLPPFPLEEPLALSLLHYFHPIPPFFPDAIEFSRTDFSSSVRRFTVEYNLSSPLPSHVSSSFPCSYGIETEPLLRYLNDRVSAIELGLEHLPAFDRRLLPKGKKGDASYGQKLESEGRTGSESKRRWEAEIRGLDGQGSKISAKYKVETSSGKKDEPKKENPRTVRIVEIEEPERNPVNQGVVGKRKDVTVKGRVSKGKKKELSPLDAALLLQTKFRAHRIRRSQTIRGLRDLAVAKAKLNDLRSLFNSFSYRRRLTVETGERQRFSERTIVLILTVEAIVGWGPMIRKARRAMIMELEAMLDAVNPQPTGKMSPFRRKLDLPGQSGNAELKEIARGVAEVVHFLDQDGIKEELQEVSL